MSSQNRFGEFGWPTFEECTPYGIAFKIVNRTSLLNIPATSGAFIEVMTELMKFEGLFSGLREFCLPEEMHAVSRHLLKREHERVDEVGELRLDPQVDLLRVLQAAAGPWL